MKKARRNSVVSIIFQMARQISNIRFGHIYCENIRNGPALWLLNLLANPPMENILCSPDKEPDLWMEPGLISGSVQVKDKVIEILNSLRGALQADGGDIELVDVIEDQGIVKVRLTGACGSCPMSQMTLQMGVERVVKQHVPQVKRVIAVRDEDE
jgi:Fe-S cluster biogenesis protein NfuA